MSPGGKRKFCFRNGKFFVIASAMSKTSSWIAMGPDRKITIPFTLILLAASWPTVYMFNHLEESNLAFIILLSYVVMITSYLYTSLCDPGVIRPEEDNSLENKATLEPLGYTYCTICGLYRPPHSYHCSDCNVCYYDHDHHCTFMGQCVARNNKMSFYIFLAFLLIYLILLEICTMSMLSSSSTVTRDFSLLVQIIKQSLNKSNNLRKSSNTI